MPIVGSAWFPVGMFLLFNSILNYLPDAYPEYVASVLAGNDLMRSAFGAGFPLFGKRQNCPSEYSCGLANRPNHYSHSNVSQSGYRVGQLYTSVHQRSIYSYPICTTQGKLCECRKTYMLELTSSYSTAGHCAGITAGTRGRTFDQQDTSVSEKHLWHEISINMSKLIELRTDFVWKPIPELDLTIYGRLF